MPNFWRSRGKLWWVCLRARDLRIRREKSSFEGWGKLKLLLFVQFPRWWLEKDVCRPWGRLLVGSVVRGSIDFSYLPVVGTRTICLFGGLCVSYLVFVTGPRPAKHILSRCVDIWQSSYPKDKVCVWRTAGQKPLKCLLSCPVPTISFKESYRVTSCLC